VILYFDFNNNIFFKSSWLSLFDFGAGFFGADFFGAGFFPTLTTEPFSNLKPLLNLPLSSRAYL
jgi:hypothetical protein